MNIRNLSDMQARAYEKLSDTEWKSSYDLRVAMVTLDSLVDKGRALRRGEEKLGAIFSPRTTIEYLRIPLKKN